MTYTIDVRAFTESISDLQLEQLCRENPDRRFEIDTQGKLIIMSPTGSESGKRNGDLFGQVWYWNRQSRSGIVFDSSTGFKLSNGAIRSPDVSWIAIERWNSLSEELKRGFARGLQAPEFDSGDSPSPIDPDFVIELLSPSDELAKTQQKMQEYLSCGVKLGWLINPDAKEVEIYRRGKDKEIVKNPSSLLGEELLPGLNVDLTAIL